MEFLSLLTSAMSACSNWFLQILDSSGTHLIYLSFIVLWTFYRFIFAPIFGIAHLSAAADVVSKAKNYKAPQKVTDRRMTVVSDRYE